MDKYRNFIINKILNLKGEYEHFIWDLPNIEYEEYLLKLNYMSDKELLDEFEELICKYLT